MCAGDDQMKNGKSPTRKQKILITKAGLELENWLVSKATAYGLLLVHRWTDQKKYLPL